jgi:ATP-dependent helicase/nuclease subunit B
MVIRVFSGWLRPLVDPTVDWLLARREQLPGLCVVVPTAHSGRRIRERLAERANAILPPQFATPAMLLQSEAEHAAPPWLETLAWCEVLDQITDWSEMGELFPHPPELEKGSCPPLAGELIRLATRLQDNGHTFATASRILAATQEGGRWRGLAALEHRLRHQLRTWGAESRSDILAQRVVNPLPQREYLLAGVTDMPPLVARWFRETEKPVTALIGAPEEQAAGFDDLGIPLLEWAQTTMPWPEEGQGGVHVVSDAAAQQQEVIRLVSAAGTPSDQLALGTGDAGLSADIARAFTQRGWPAFDPTTPSTATGLRRWLRAWAAWLHEESTGRLSELLADPESGLIGPTHERIAALHTLGRLRDRFLLSTVDDLMRIPPGCKEESPHRDWLALANAAVQLRARFLALPFPDAMRQLLDMAHAEDADAHFIRTWLDAIQPVYAQTSRCATFWIELLLTALPHPTPAPPEERVIDVLGWLELPFESGSHLVVCGMNDGQVPSSSEGDPWLGAQGEKVLGLPDHSLRAARDAFLARHMFECRRAHGRIDWILAKSGAGGESLRPSRILLCCQGEELAKRVRHLFRDIPPTEAGVRWHADWKWQPRVLEPPPRISVTAFQDWIACPFRYYLKHVVRMSKAAPDRIEWNHRDFGNVFHQVVEAWAKDEEARDFRTSDALASWFSHRLNIIVAKQFGRSPTLAIRMQAESLRNRLHWFAEEQALLRAEGWRPIHAERKCTLTIGGWTISGSIDRIDEHPEHGLRVIDYKTASTLGKVTSAHCTKVTTLTQQPAHWGDDSPILFTAIENGKPVTMRWQNLQLPLYAAAVLELHGSLPQPCYIGVGASRKQVKVDPWLDFSPHEMAAATACAGWIIENIQQGVFWPPAEKALHAIDEVTSLSCGKSPAALFESIAQKSRTV